MKTFKKIALAVISLLIISCSSDSDNNTNDETALDKRIIYQTQSLNPQLNTKEIQYYSNNEIVADTIFNNLNEWTHRKTITFNGTTKTYQTLNTNGQVTAHREETFDNQGRVTSRRTFIPENLIIVSFVYNADNTVTANATNTLDQTTFHIATYHKNSDGVIYKEFKQPTGFQPNDVIESTILFEGLKPISMINSFNSSVVNFQYHPNPMPTDLLKSADELNNEVLLGLTLTRLSEEGNFYPERTGGSSNGITTTYQIDFNADNYIEYAKSTYVNTNGNNNLLTTETFYYYN